MTLPVLLDAVSYTHLDVYKRQVLTPHMKEMSRLAGVGIKKIKEQRIPFLEEFVQEYGCTCISVSYTHLYGNRTTFRDSELETVSVLSS